MELEALFELERKRNESGFIGPDFFLNNLRITIPYLIFTCTSTLLGTVGNTLVILAVNKVKELHTNGNLIIANLACADMCVTGFVGPMAILGIIVGEGFFTIHPWLCAITVAMCGTSCFCSLNSIAALSINRYICIVHNQYYARIYTNRNTWIIIVCLWLAAFICQSTPFLGWGSYSYDRKAFTCVWDRMADRSNTYFMVFGSIGVPIAITTFGYVAIFLFYRKHCKKVANTFKQSESNENKTSPAVFRLARTLSIIFFVFLVCWMPYSFCILFDVYDTFPVELHSAAIAMAHINSSVNFAIYGITNKSFRNGYAYVLSKKNARESARFAISLHSRQQ